MLTPSGLTIPPPRHHKQCLVCRVRLVRLALSMSANIKRCSAFWAISTRV
jgi:hypothetical protein